MQSSRCHICIIFRQAEQKFGDIPILINHINSCARKKLNNRSLPQLFSTIHGEDILAKLRQKLIPADEIILTPMLLKQR